MVIFRFPWGNEMRYLKFEKKALSRFLSRVLQQIQISVFVTRQCFFFFSPLKCMVFCLQAGVSALGTCSFRGVQKRAWDSLGLELEIA